MSTDPAWVAADAPLPSAELSRCGGCGYLLEGLSAQGNCPECNEAYDRQEIVLLGRLVGAYSRTWWLRPGVTSVALTLIAIALYQIEPYLGWGFAAIVSLPGLIVALNRTLTSQAYEVVVRMNAEGVGLRRGAGSATAVPLVPWSSVTRLRLIPKRNDRLWIWVRCGRTDLFDVLVDCRHEHVEELRTRIASWFND